MSATAFVLGRHGRAILTRTVRHHQCLGPFAQLSATRDLTMTAVGRRALPRADWDTLGIWLDEPVALPPLSARYTRTSSAVAASATGCASHTGKRRENEDRFAISRLSEDVLLFAIFDGHGGDSAAEFCSKKLPYLIQRKLIQESELESVLKKSFIQIDSYFLESISTTEEEEELLSSGTTATVALLRNETELLVATVGDSRAVLCRAGKAECLTEDHNARRKDERQRIQECGGFIEWNSVGEPYVNGRLAMTRSIGDFQVKPYGVIALPEITTVNVDHNSDSFLVLTTDGVSGIMDSQEMCEIIKKCQDPSEAAYIVNDQALQYGSQDNVTTLVIPFGAWGKYKNAFRSSNFGRMMVASCRWG